jgi:thiol-disulfide isomerase/thioredoxin
LAVWCAAACCALPAPASAESTLFRSLGIQTPQESVEAPEFSLPDPAGRTIRLKEHRGRFVFLNFFATWCGPCRQEMPAIERLHQAYGKKGLAVLAIDLQESPKEVARFVAELGLTFPAAIDADGSVSHEYAVRGLPVTFLVDRQGRILWRAVGSREWDSQSMRKYFGALLDGAPTKAGGSRR